MPSSLRTPLQPRELRIVAVEHGRAAGLEALENFRLGVGDRLEPAKNSRCTGSTVVMTATCGRTIFTSGVISPAWFMPISKIAKRASPGSAPATAARPNDC